MRHAPHHRHLPRAVAMAAVHPPSTLRWAPLLTAIAAALWALAR